MALARKAHLSLEEYLQWEPTQPEKHEYWRGEVFAMGGAKRDHVTVAGNIYALLKTHLRKGLCRAYIADMMLKIEAANAAFYPDVMVTCDKRDLKSELFMSSPKLIIEVLSESTEAFDRGAKFTCYRQLASLEEYVLVDLPMRSVECYRRDAENNWVLHDYQQSKFEFASIRFRGKLKDVFEDI